MGKTINNIYAYQPFTVYNISSVTNTITHTVAGDTQLFGNESLALAPGEWAKFVPLNNTGTIKQVDGSVKPNVSYENTSVYYENDLVIV